MPSARGAAAFVTSAILFPLVTTEAFIVSVPPPRLTTSSRSTLSRQNVQMSTPSSSQGSDSVLSTPVSQPSVALVQTGSYLGQRILSKGPIGGQYGEPPDDNDFDINVGRALDTLAHDVPLMFASPPRLEIFTSNVVLKTQVGWTTLNAQLAIVVDIPTFRRETWLPCFLRSCKDPVGELLHGRRLYGALHTSLRVLGAITAIKPRVGVSSICFSRARQVVELKWTLTAGSSFMGDQNALKLSAVSLYRINDEGLIYEHSIDNRIKRDLWEYSHSWMGMLTGDRPPKVPTASNELT